MEESAAQIGQSSESAAKINSKDLQPDFNIEVASKEIAEALGVDIVDLGQYEINKDLCSLLEEDYCRNNNCVPFHIDDKNIKVALNDPANIRTPDIIVSLLPENEITFYYAPEDEIIKFTNALFVPDYEEVEIKSEVVINSNDLNLDAADNSDLVNVILKQALQSGASDIYFEQNDLSCRIRFRIDGVCHTLKTLYKSVYSQIISKIKVRSKIDISKKKKSLDGRFTVIYGGMRCDMRVATFPTVCDENITIRVLKKDKNLLSVDTLGMPTQVEKGYYNFLDSQFGLCLVSGPTGSGKTTTLYAGLSHVNDESRKIITIENPVEYQINGLSQQEVDGKNTTFYDGLKASLRQAPDIIMVGEIRDFETADTACKAAMTGHLVMSTIHTNNAVATISRLRDMGIQDHLIGASLSTVIAQRLVRKLCTCAKDGKPIGCSKCFHSGYSGRVAVYELLDIRGKDISFFTKRSRREALDLLKKEGYKTIYDHGKDVFSQGTISEDILRSLWDFD